MNRIIIWHVLYAQFVGKLNIEQEKEHVRNGLLEINV